MNATIVENLVQTYQRIMKTFDSEQRIIVNLELFNCKDLSHKEACSTVQHETDRTTRP